MADNPLIHFPTFGWPECILPCLTAFTTTHTQDIFTNIFGGVDINEGLGLFSVCFDWDLITSWVLSFITDTNV